MSIRLAVPVVPSNRTHALLSYKGPVVNVDRGMTTGAPVPVRRARAATTGVPLKHRNVSLEKARSMLIIEPPVLTKKQFEMPEQVYDEFDEYDRVAIQVRLDYGDTTDDIRMLNRNRFVKYLEKTVAPMVPKEFKDKTGEEMLTVFEENIANMNFWNKKGVFTYDEVITTFRGPTFWLSNMFPTMIYYDSVTDMFDTHNGDNGQGAKIQKMNDLMREVLDPQKLVRLDENVESLYRMVQTQFFVDPRKRLFASPEHKFMASKVKVGSLIEDAVKDLKTAPPDPMKMNMAMRGIELFEQIRMQETAKEAKKLANNMEDRATRTRPLTKDQKKLLHSTDGGPASEWASINQKIMARAIAKKFLAMPLLVGLLKKLKGYQIFEGNYFFDDLWGVKFDLVPWAPSSRLVKDPDDKVRGVLLNTEGDATVLEGMNWLGRCHMAVADAPGAERMTEDELYALLMSAMTKAPLWRAV